MTTSQSNPFDGLHDPAFQAVEWQTLILKCPTKECSAYQESFRDRARELDLAGKVEPARAARVLQWVSALQIRTDQPRQAFRGLRLMPNLQLPDPEDFGEPILAILANMAREASDSEFKARLADVCWCTQIKRHFPLVEIAIRGYLDSSKRLRSPVVGEDSVDALRRWEHATIRLKRALQLAKTLRHTLLPNVQLELQSVFRDSLEVIPLLELGQLLTEYQNHLENDIEWLITVSGEAANRARTEGQWSHLRHLLRLKANWQNKANRLAEAIATEEERAEVYVPEAESNQTLHGRARLIAKAIVTLRKVSPGSSRIEALKKLMEDSQRRGMGEMHSRSFQVTLGSNHLAAAKHVAGQPLSIALQRLVTLHPPIVEGEVREAVTKRCDNPWYAITGQDLIDWEGRVIARRGSMLSEDSEVREHAIRAEMFRTALDQQKVVVAGLVEPARLQILSEQNPGFHDFYDLLVDSPFIPPGRESLFVRGLYEGLNGDFTLAAHLLIPQLEHALRFHIEQLGVDVTTLNKDGIQELMDLNKMFCLRQEPLRSVFGDDQVFELEGLLVRRYGSNLRNSFAHGLIWPDQFFDSSVIYLWWVTFRLSIMHTLRPASDAS
jgi:hypothetical protein